MPSKNVIAKVVAAGVATTLMGCMAANGPHDGNSRGGPSVLGYINHIPPETEAAKQARHTLVAQRRTGLPIIVHRGASALAPENTLEAYAATMDLGADGVEIDIRRSADGVLYLFHDTKLERLTHGTGEVAALSYYELLRITPKDVYGSATKETRPPTLAALLVLARQRAALLHLDIKEPGLQDDIARLLDEADVWDHIVEINNYNADKLLADPRVKRIGYKGWIPVEADETAMWEYLEEARRCGQMVFCDDPRPALKALGRPRRDSVPLPDGLRAEWAPSGLRLP